jgi:hypothetical protein
MKVTNKAPEIRFRNLVPRLVVNTPTSFGYYLFNTTNRTGESENF